MSNPNRTTTIDVPSASEPGITYCVSRRGDYVTCTCKGYQYRGKCKHAEAFAPSREERVEMTPATQRNVISSFVASLDQPAPLPCVCGWYHLTDAERRKAHPDALPAQSRYAAEQGEPLPEPARVRLVRYA